MTSQRTSREALIKRLSGYWKMEAGNVVLIPAIILYLTEAKLSLLTWLALVPMMGLLLIGTVYWKAKLAQIEIGTDIAPVAMILARWQWPMLGLTLAALAAMVTLWIEPSLATGRADQWSGTAAATLAALEYVNYYHRQLQHFDHWADWKRLLSGRGFRRSQLREDIDRLKRERSST